MAHIVGRHFEGPRGDYPEPPADLDSNENLILLCPNDHTRIDKDIDGWSVERLRSTKAEHERWVRDRLESGQLTPVEFDSSSFRDERFEAWMSSTEEWCYAALTPLTIVEDSVDPLASTAPEILQGLALPNLISVAFQGQINYGRIEGSENGLIVEDYRQRPIGGEVGYRLEIFRNGHVEYGVSLCPALDERTEEQLRDLSPLKKPDGLSSHRRTRFTRSLRWDRWAPCLVSQVEVLRKLWQTVPLPTHDMILTVALTRLRGATLMVIPDPHRWAVGRPLEKDHLTASFVVNNTASVSSLAEVVLKRLANSFSFDLPPFGQETSDLATPELFRR